MTNRSPSRSRKRFAITGLAAAWLCLAAAPAAADMYTWKDPVDGRTRMSNIAPSWLREPVPGKRMPKVEVIRDQKVIDAATAFANPQEPARPSAKQMAAVKPAPEPVIGPDEEEDKEEDK